MKAVQDSYDATTRLTLSCKKLGQEIMHSNMAVAGSNVAQMVQTGIRLCADLVKPTTDIEAILMAPMNTTTRDAAVTALKACAIPFEKLERCYQELAMMKKYKDKQSASSSPASGKRNISFDVN